MPAETHDPFLAKVAEILEVLDAGQQPDLEDLCRDHPEWIPPIEEMLSERSRLARYEDGVKGYDPREDQVIADRFVLRERIGSGAMGVVYRARDRQLGRDVAVKMLRAGVVKAEEYDARLVREAELLASLRHPNVLTLHDRGTLQGGRSFLVMDLLQGMSASELIEHLVHACGESVHFGHAMTTLAACFPSAVFPETTYVRQVVKWIALVARGLQAAHEQGAVHRDIKPSNIFIREDGVPVLIDFGIATLGREHTLALREGTLGTPAYMAPEQLQSSTEASESTDVYGLAAALYHLLSLQRPYEGTPQQVIAATLKRDPVPLERRAPALPSDLKAILSKAMMREPHLRYQRAADLASDLEAWLEFRPVSARPLGPCRKGLRVLKRSTALQVTLALALSTVLVLTLLSLYRRAQEDQATQYGEAYAKVAPLHFLRLPRLRPVRDEALLGQVRATLNQLVQNASRPLPARLIRAGFHLDQGEPERALDDWLAVSRAHPSPLTRELTRRYRTLDREARTVLDLGRLPGVQNDVDRYVLAYHEVRGEQPQFKQLLALLEAITTNVPGAADLELVLEAFQVKRIKDPERRTSAALDLLAQCKEREAAHGSATAITAHVHGHALHLLNRFESAARVFESGARLSPWDFGLWISAGTSWHYGRNFKKARACLRRALEIQPASSAVRPLLIENEIHDGEWNAAEALWDELADDSPDKLRLEGMLFLARANSRDERTSPEERQALALQAKDCFEDLRAIHGINLPWERIVTRLMTRDPNVPFSLAARTLNAQPYVDARKLASLMMQMPSSMHEEATSAIRDIVLRYISQTTFAPRSKSKKEPR